VDGVGEWTDVASLDEVAIASTLPPKPTADHLHDTPLGSNSSKGTTLKASLRGLPLPLSWWREKERRLARWGKEELIEKREGGREREGGWEAAPTAE
jgi:hypothetical protein